MNFFRMSIFAGFLGLCLVVFADPAAEKEAEKLLNIMGMDEALKQSMSQMLDLQLQQSPALAPYKNVMMEFFNKHMSYESLKPDILKIYAEAFTASELKEISTFYSSAVGKKTIEKMPVLMVQGGQIGATRVQKNIDELQAMIKTESERIQKLQQQ